MIELQLILFPKDLTCYNNMLANFVYWYLNGQNEYFIIVAMFFKIINNLLFLFRCRIWNSLEKMSDRFDRRSVIW